MIEKKYDHEKDQDAYSLRIMELIKHLDEWAAENFNEFAHPMESLLNTMSNFVAKTMLVNVKPGEEKDALAHFIENFEIIYEALHSDGESIRKKARHQVIYKTSENLH